MCRLHQRTQLTVLFGIMLAIAIHSPAIAAELRTVQQPVPGQYIVVLKSTEARMAAERGTAAPVAIVASRIVSRYGATLLGSYDYVLRGFAVRADDDALIRLLMDPRVAYVEEDGIVKANATQMNAPWGLDRVDQRDLPLNTNYVYNSAATGVNAYVIDTGVLATHSQFTGRIGNGYYAVQDGRGNTDCNGHGTHVAGILGGSTYGVAKGATLHSVRVLGCDGTGTSSQVIAGINWIAANRVGPAVANMSLISGADSSMDTATTNLVAAGVVVVVAAGNDSTNACNFSPSRVASAITVGSIRTNDGRSYFSNYGSCLDLFAPGSSILSAWYTTPTATNVLSGTSMASPQVAGAAALYLAANPTATPAQVASNLTSTASPGRVLAAGSGSPNRLLYTRGGTTSAPPGDGTLPSNVQFKCPDMSSSGGGRYVCRVTYSSTSPATVIWPNTDSSSTTYSGTCVKGTTVGSITVIVGNRYGSVSKASASFSCPSNPIP